MIALPTRKNILANDSSLLGYEFTENTHGSNDSYTVVSVQVNLSTVFTCRGETIGLSWLFKHLNQ